MTLNRFPMKNKVILFNIFYTCWDYVGQYISTVTQWILMFFACDKNEATNFNSMSLNFIHIL